MELSASMVLGFSTFAWQKLMQHVIKKLRKYTNWWWSRIYMRWTNNKQHFGFFHQRNICKFAGQAISIYRNHTLIWGPETVWRTNDDLNLPALLAWNGLEGNILQHYFVHLNGFFKGFLGINVPKIASQNASGSAVGTSSSSASWGPPSTCKMLELNGDIRVYFHLQLLEKIQVHPVLKKVPVDISSAFWKEMPKFRTRKEGHG